MSIKYIYGHAYQDENGRHEQRNVYHDREIEVFDGP